MKKLNIGMLGYGTVSKGVETLLNQQENMTLHAIFRRPGKAFGPLMTDQIRDLIDDPAIDTIVEAMGGLEPAHDYLAKAMIAGKNVVTANKALVNAFGDELNALAIKHQVSFLFSAACGGGIPFLPAMVESLNKHRITSLGGILNGTTNFIIDKMEREALSFEEALKQAQDLGYAEADPIRDLNGTDTRDKLRLAMAVGMKCWIDPDSIDFVGISALKAVDIAIFKTYHGKLRLVCFGHDGHGQTSAYVQPTLVDHKSDYAAILENNNLAWFKTANGETSALTGQGAGSLPTASNIIRDLITIQWGTQVFLNDTMPIKKADNLRDELAYYVRTSKGLHAPFLSDHTSESWEDEFWIFRITSPIKVKTMHREMKELSIQGEVFFAGIKPGEKP